MDRLFENIDLLVKRLENSGREHPPLTKQEILFLIQAICHQHVTIERLNLDIKELEDRINNLEGK